MESKYSIIPTLIFFIDWAKRNGYYVEDADVISMDEVKNALGVLTSQESQIAAIRLSKSPSVSQEPSNSDTKFSVMINTSSVCKVVCKWLINNH